MGPRIAVHSNQFIVGSVCENIGFRSFSIASSPHIHDNYKDAVREAERLAADNPAKKFVVYAIVAVASREPKPIPPVSVTYSL